MPAPGCGRGLARELDDVLAEVGLADVQPGRLELFVEGDLLGGHRLRLDDPPDAPPPGDGEDVAADVGRAGGSRDVSSVRLDLAGQLVEERVRRARASRAVR